MYELPPYRPPSEAQSVLIRATRGCPWNQCGFCGMYKGTRFEIRPRDDILADIETARQALAGARVRSAFIGDANSLVMKVEDLEAVLRALRSAFPTLERITTYARAFTLARTPVENLFRLREAGLTRVHVGLETGSRGLLAELRKGATPEQMIEGGRRARAAGLTLSEYVILGLGGEDRWEEHARESARLLTEIDPDFIRVRTIAVLPGTPLGEALAAGRFRLPRVVTLLSEERLLIASLDGVHSRFVSDHVSNLLPIEGQLPEDRASMLAAIDAARSRLERRGLDPTLEEVRPLSAL